jgi:hypothetical protein
MTTPAAPQPTESWLSRVAHALVGVFGTKRPSWEAEVAAVANTPYKAYLTDCSNKNAEAARILRRHGAVCHLCKCRAIGVTVTGIGGLKVPVDHAIIRITDGPAYARWMDATGPRLATYNQLPPKLGRAVDVPEAEWADAATATAEWKWGQP